MDFKTIFGEALASQIQTKLDEYNQSAEKKVKLANLSEGGYVSKEKHQDKLNALQAQIDDYKAQVSKRDADLQALHDQLSKADPAKLDEVSASLTALQSRYDEDAKAWQAKLDAQAYEFLIREKASELTFTSNAAKKAFVADAIAKGFKLDGDSLLGYNDWLNAYKEADPGSFVADPAGSDVKKPMITMPTEPAGGSKSGMSLADQMRAKNLDEHFVPQF